jgi:hypothetical protein
VTAQQAAPVNYFHQTTFAITTSRGCLVIAIPPARRALVVRDVRVDVFADPTPGPDNDLVVFGDATCTDTVGDVNPGALGETVLPFDPGLGVAATSGLSARATGGVEAETYVDGYTVAPSSVPAPAAAVTTGRGGPSQG